jgi:hypothetical protein
MKVLNGKRGENFPAENSTFIGKSFGMKVLVYRGTPCARFVIQISEHSWWYLS